MADARMTRAEQADRATERASMVRRIAELMHTSASETGISELDPRVREEPESVPRHRFVPQEARHLAYDQGLDS